MPDFSRVHLLRIDLGGTFEKRIWLGRWNRAGGKVTLATGIRDFTRPVFFRLRYPFRIPPEAGVVIVEDWMEERQQVNRYVSSPPSIDGETTRRRDSSKKRRLLER
jgi:hypothetical protein